MGNSSPGNESAIREYFRSKMAASGLAPGTARWGRSDVFERARLALLDGLLRLDKLPRNDPLWLNWANHSATVAKLSDYSHRWLQWSPADPDAIWLVAALNLYYCDNDFGCQSWRALHALGKLQAAWAIDAAAYVELSSGVPTAAEVAALLRDLGRQEEGRAYLTNLPEGWPIWLGSKSTGCHRAWAQAVLSALDL